MMSFLVEINVIITPENKSKCKFQVYLCKFSSIFSDIGVKDSISKLNLLEKNE